MPSILVVDDKDSMRTMLSQALSDEGYQVDAVEGGKKALDLARLKSYDLAITDLKMPEMDGLSVLSGLKEIDSDMTVIIMTAYGTVESAVEAMKQGAFDFITKPFDPDHLRVIIERALENRRLIAENSLLREELAQNLGFSEIIGQNEKMKEVSRLIQKVAGSDTSVLLQGESGTGKELFARAIHNLSPRKNGNYVVINCGTLPPQLFESELFGYVKGAFTDAKKDKAGKLSRAEEGTVFFDEIGELPLSTQVKLLRLLQQREYEPVGSTGAVNADIRIVAATNKDLRELVAQGKFRDDLYFRLAVVKFDLPPLTSRREDIPYLVDHFIKRNNARRGKNIVSVSPEVMNILMRYDFPGNIRELENIIEYAFVICRGSIIHPEHLPTELNGAEQLLPASAVSDGTPLFKAIDEQSRIENALRQFRGHQGKTAAALGIERTTLWRKLKRYNIDPQKYRES